MKRYSRIWFIITVVLICINLAASVYYRNFTGVVAWCLVLLAEFRMRSYDKEIDELRERVDYWHRIATGK